MLERLDLRGVTGDLAAALPRPRLDEEGPVEAVRGIVADVRARGDAALRELTARFDGVEISAVRVPPDEVGAALDVIGPDLREALEEAREAIEAFHAHSVQRAEAFERAGVRVETLVRPVARAGLYAPGGRARYPSTVLMCALPARVAGVGALALCVPPGPDGRIAAPTLAAAALAGIDEVYRVGGAQAIAALAYGTESVPAVDVIVGPGNRYVSIAKRLVAGQVGVPSAFAGPSEVVVVADATVPAEWAAIDVIVQAEHGPDGLAWLVTWDESVVDTVTKAVEDLVAAAPRRAEIEATLAAGGHAVVVEDPQRAIDVANAVAPEHLELMCAGPEELLPLVENAGAVFCGPFAPASVGDYVAGPNHVLPTYRSARFASALGVADFVRHSHAITLDEPALRRVARSVQVIAAAEGLDAHARSVRLRVPPGS